MKTKIKLELHKFDQFLLLDFQDCYKYISKNTEKEVELVHYIAKFCQSKNYPILKTPDMAFDAVTEFQLKSWVDGYNFAKHHKINTNKLTIEGSWYIIEYNEPFEI